MFSEILRIKPVLDSAAAKQMDQSLSQRFGNVAKRFGGGLKSLLKGTVAGISLGLLNRLLNPIEALEEKIKNLLGQGTDLRELAGRFNTSPGQIKRIEDLASSVGVQPDQLKDLMLKFATAVETARREIADPFQAPSEQTQAVRNFVNEKDLAEGFFRFMQSLKVEGQGPGKDVFLSDRGKARAAELAAKGEVLSDEERKQLLAKGLLRHASGAEMRSEFERLVFGEQLFGAQKKLIDVNPTDQFQKLNEPSAGKLTGKIGKLADLADQQRLLQTRNDTKDLMRGSDIMNPKMIHDMEAANAKQEERIARQLKSYDDLRRAADGIETLKEPIIKLGEMATQGLGLLGPLVDWFKKPAAKANGEKNPSLAGGKRER